MRRALSRRRFPSSHDVSGNKQQPWQAAKFALSEPCPLLSMQIGSEEHQLTALSARRNVSSSRLGCPWRTKPPIVPSESPEDV